VLLPVRMNSRAKPGDVLGGIVSMEADANPLSRRRYGGRPNRLDVKAEPPKGACKLDDAVVACENTASAAVSLSSNKYPLARCRPRQSPRHTRQNNALDGTGRGQHSAAG